MNQFFATIRTLCGTAAVLLMTSSATAQLVAPPGGGGGGVVRDEPTSFQDPTVGEEKEESSGAMRVVEAVCWYLPNRVIDLLDIPRAYISVGDSLGASVRATKYMNTTWLENNAACFGLSRRQPIMFTEDIEEKYFGFFAAQGGELDRDPTEVGFSLSLIGGLNFALSLGEAADFGAGIVGIDLNDDDHGPTLGRDYTADEEELPVWVEEEEMERTAPVTAPDPGEPDAISETQ